MQSDKELMQEALYALTYVGDAKEIYSDTIESLRARLTQPEQEPIKYEEWNYDPMTGKPLWGEQPEPEPVAWFMEGTFEDGTPSFTQVCETDPEFYVPLYTAPPQREWQGLTDEERTFLAWESNNGPECVAMTEAKLKEKNGTS